MCAIRSPVLVTEVSHINSQGLLEVSIGSPHLYWNEVHEWTVWNFCKERKLKDVSISFVVNILACQFPENCVKKWRATGSVCDIQKQSRRIVLTEENVRDTEARIQISPRKLLRHLARETSISLGSAFTATKLIEFRLYKITVVHELKQPDYAARISFYNWLLWSLR
jgi:hypothetical protein